MEKGFFKEDIVYYDNFLSEEESAKLVDYYSQRTDWTPVSFYGSYGMNMVSDDQQLEDFGLPRDFLAIVETRMHQSAEEAHNRKLIKVSTHSQKWETGGFAPYHSDNSNMDGSPSAWEKSKIVCLLYLNNNYGGGELVFRDHDIKISPPTGTLITFPGGIINVHAVEEVTHGTRYTLGSFWDYAESEYSEERRKEWEEEITRERVRQQEMFDQWDKEKK